MKVLIIGGTGLISTAIVDQLVARGDEVALFNRGQTPRRIAASVPVIRGDRWDYPAPSCARSPGARGTSSSARPRACTAAR
jgi:nucleoside-diphosphate-sugar epimerase